MGPETNFGQLHQLFNNITPHRTPGINDKLLIENHLSPQLLLIFNSYLAEIHGLSSIRVASGASPESCVMRIGMDKKVKVKVKIKK
jgi:hypothetical protein